MRVSENGMKKLIPVLFAIVVMLATGCANLDKWQHRNDASKYGTFSKK